MGFFGPKPAFPYVEDKGVRNPGMRLALLPPPPEDPEDYFPFSDATYDRIKEDWGQINFEVGSRLRDLTEKKAKRLKKKAKRLDIRTAPFEAINIEKDFIACGGQGCVYHAMGHDSGYVAKITKSIPEVLAWRLVSMDKELYQHPGVAIPRFIVERNYEDDESIPEDERRIFIIGREKVIPVESEEFEEVFPDIAGQPVLDDLEEALSDVEDWSKTLHDKIVWLTNHCSYKEILGNVRALQQIAAIDEKTTDAIAHLREIPGAKRLADFIAICMDRGLLLTDLKLRNVGVRVVPRGKKLPPKHRFVLYDFLSVTPEEHLSSNPTEPLLLPDWAMNCGQ